MQQPNATHPPTPATTPPRSVNCPTCTKPLLAKPRGRPSANPRRVDPADYVVCDGCRRCFHESCLKAKGVAVEPSKDGTWFHDPDCKAAMEALQHQAERGEQPLPGGRSWQLVALRSRLGGRRDGASGKPVRVKQLHTLLDVLAPEYVSRALIGAGVRVDDEGAGASLR